MSRSLDLEQKIIETVYAGACNSAALAQAPELIASYFDGTGAFFGEFDYAVPDAQFTTGVGTVDEAFLNDYAVYAPIDPAPEKFAALPVGTATTTDRMFSAEFLRSNVMLNDFLQPRGIAGTLGSPLLSAAGRFAIIGIHQSAGQEPFDEDDITRLERLTPHLTRALQIRRLFLENEIRGQALEAILNRKAAGVIALDRGGRVLFVNEAVRAMARARDGISVDRDGRLVLADRQSAKRLTKLEADVVRGGLGRHRPRPPAVGRGALCGAGVSTVYFGRRIVARSSQRGADCDPRSGAPHCFFAAIDHAAFALAAWCGQGGCRLARRH